MFEAYIVFFIKVLSFYEEAYSTVIVMQFSPHSVHMDYRFQCFGNDCMNLRHRNYFSES